MLERKSPRSTSARHNSRRTRKEWNICTMCDDGGGWAQGCGKEKAAARSPFLGFPVMGVMRASKVKSVACELTGPSVSLYSIRLHTTYCTCRQGHFLHLHFSNRYINYLTYAECILKYQNVIFRKWSFSIGG